MAGKFPSKYMNALISGQALGGIFAASANIVSIALGASPIDSAFIYFLVADITLVVALVLYMTLCSSVNSFQLKITTSTTFFTDACEFRSFSLTIHLRRNVRRRLDRSTCLKMKSFSSLLDFRTVASSVKYFSSSNHSFFLCNRILINSPNRSGRICFRSH